MTLLDRQEPACAVCGSRDHRLAFAPLSITRCRSCGFLWRPYDLPPDHYVSHDRYAAYLGDPVRLALRRENARARLNAIESVCSSPGAPLLEVGSHEGMFLDVAREGGYRPVGCEPSAVAAAHALTRGHTVLQVTLDEGLPTLLRMPRFGIIAAFHVLEHAPDPRAFLGTIARLLLPGGCVALEVPDITAPWARINEWNDPRIQREHISYFSRRTLAILLRSCGFRVLYAHRRSFDELHAPLFNNLVRLPLLTMLYRAAKRAKQWARGVAGQEPERKTYDDPSDLWPSGPLRAEPYWGERPLGHVLAALDRGEDILMIARRAA